LHNERSAGITQLTQVFGFLLEICSLGENHRGAKDQQTKCSYESCSSNLIHQLKENYVVIIKEGWWVNDVTDIEMIINQQNKEQFS
jgi:hypothetical protein